MFRIFEDFTVGGLTHQKDIKAAEFEKTQIMVSGILGRYFNKRVFIETEEAWVEM